MVGRKNADIADTLLPVPKGRCHGNHFLAFYIRSVHWRHLANTTESSMCGWRYGCQITLTTVTFANDCDRGWG